MKGRERTVTLFPTLDGPPQLFPHQKTTIERTGIFKWGPKGEGFEEVMATVRGNGGGHRFYLRLSEHQTHILMGDPHS